MEYKTMKTKVTENDFINAFQSIGAADSWSISGLRALFEWLEELEDDTGEEIELDVIALDCDYTEWSSFTEWLEQYYGKPLYGALKDAGIDLDEDEDELDELIRSHIQDHGQLIEFSGGIIVSSF